MHSTPKARRPLSLGLALKPGGSKNPDSPEGTSEFLKQNHHEQRPTISVEPKTHSLYPNTLGNGIFTYIHPLFNHPNASKYAILGVSGRW